MAHRRNVIISILFVILGGPGFVLVYVPLWITHFRVPLSEPWWQMMAAGVLIAAGILPLLESAGRFVTIGRGTLVPTAPTERLVVSGLYRHVRNPMYVGVVTALVGEAILFESRDMAAYVPLIWIACHLFVFFYEEPALARRYGEQYARFKQHVPRWMPRLTAWNGGE